MVRRREIGGLEDGEEGNEKRTGKRDWNGEIGAPLGGGDERGGLVGEIAGRRHHRHHKRKKTGTSGALPFRSGSKRKGMRGEGDDCPMVNNQRESSALQLKPG